jgi:D-arabinose 1-dehydrogenase-like Zn-dependent alcohol dehydrogenase
VDFVGTRSTIPKSFEVVKYRGTVVVRGLGSDAAPVSVIELVLGAMTLKGSLGSGNNPRELPGIFEMIAAGTITPHTSLVDFADLNAAYQRLVNGDVQGRLVTVCGTRSDQRVVIDLARADRLHIETQLYALDDAARACSDLRRRRVNGRAVLTSAPRPRP